MVFRFSPTAYQKIVWFLDNIKEEISGFGITSIDDPWLIEDFALVTQQSCTSSTEMEDLGKYALDMSKKGYPPNRCMRVWIHTHPGDSCKPSMQDENMFQEIMDNYEWFAMIIFGRSKDTYARVGYRNGPRIAVEVKTEVDWTVPIQPVSFEELEQEHSVKVRPMLSTNPIAKYQEPSPRDLFRNNYDNIFQPQDTKKWWKPKKKNKKKWRSLSDVEFDYDDVMEQLEDDKIDWLCKGSSVSPVQLRDYMDRNGLTADEVDKLWDCVVEEINRDYVVE